MSKTVLNPGSNALDPKWLVRQILNWVINELVALIGLCSVMMRAPSNEYVYFAVASVILTVFMVPRR